MNRRSFNKSLAYAAIGLPLIGPAKCATAFKSSNQYGSKETPYKWSLAQWSLHRTFESGDQPILDFSKIAARLGFTGVEYVSQLYSGLLAKSSSQLQGMKRLANDLTIRADDNQVSNLLVMIDGEGDLAISDPAQRAINISNHHKWVDLISEIGGHAIRVNLFGEGSREEMHDASVVALTALGKYAKDQGVSILVENHGGYSSDPYWLVDIMEKVDMTNVGLLPDFGNFCLRREDGSRWGSPCADEYPDKVGAIKMMIPYCQGISAKSYAFDNDGNETTLPYPEIIKVIQASNYDGYIGVEYEGQAPEEEGISATLNLLKRLTNQ